VNANAKASGRPLQGGGAEAGVGLVNTDRYTNRTSEMWLCMRVLLRNKQISNLHPRAVEQMTLRGFSTGRGASGIRLGVEAKKDFRKRLGGGSPDEADTAFLLIDLAIERFGLLPAEPRQAVPVSGSGMSDFYWGLAVTAAPGDLRAFDFAGRNDDAFL
jgi:hypothetical protein